jgi:hypothetical protein
MLLRLTKLWLSACGDLLLASCVMSDNVPVARDF